MEIWKDVVGYEGFYEVSNLGNVRSLDREIWIEPSATKGGYFMKRKGKIMKGSYDKDGYLTLGLSDENHKQKKFKLHRLVAIAFLPNDKNLPQVNHKNGIKDDCRLENLEWVTAQENCIHSFETGLSRTGEQHYKCKLSDDKVRFIRDNKDLYTGRELAKMFEVSPSTISTIILNKTRKYVG